MSQPNTKATTRELRAVQRGLRHLARQREKEDRRLARAHHQIEAKYAKALTALNLMRQRFRRKEALLHKQSRRLLDAEAKRLSRRQAILQGRLLSQSLSSNQ